MIFNNDDPRARRHKKERLPGVRIIYQDDDVVVVDKDAGLLVIPGHFEDEGTLLDLVETEIGREVLPVHRLDRNTSGLVITAKHADAQRYLSAQFEHHEAGKLYHAIVRGRPADAFTIDKPIQPGKRRKGLSGIDAEGKPSVTQVVTVERFIDFAHLACRPLTGRTHQIRVHLASEGFPLVCDAGYGKGLPLMLSSFKHGYRPKPGRTEPPLISRHALHASRLEIVLPGRQKISIFEADLPKDMAVALKMLRKYNR